MKKQGYSEETIKDTGKFLKGLAKGCNLDNPEAVKVCIAGKHCSNGYKMNLVWAYDRYVKAHGLQWSKPFYQRVERDPTIPTTEQIDTLINGFSRNYRPILVLAKYGLRPIEISELRVRDIDIQNRLVHVRTAKGGKARTVKLTPGDFSLLMIYLRSHEYTLEDKPFPNNRAITGNYCHFRKRLVEKTGDTSLLNVRLYISDIISLLCCIIKLRISFMSSRS